MSERKEIAGINIQELEDLAEVDDYWKSCHEFILSIKGKLPRDMSVKQMVWINKIRNSYKDAHKKRIGW